MFCLCLLVARCLAGPELEAGAPDEEPGSELEDLVISLCPVNLAKWPTYSVLMKLYKIVKAPIKFIVILTIPVVDYERPRDAWCRLLNSCHCILVPLTTTLLTSTATYVVLLRVPLYFVALVLGLILSLMVFYTSGHTKAPRYHSVYAYVGFIMSLIWVYYIAAEIVGLLKTMGLMLSMSDTVIGLGILAWGNSLGDLFANITLANRGHCRLALGACIGAPLLNLLLGFGLSFGLYLGPGGSLDVSLTPTLLYYTITTILFVLMLSTIMPPTWLRKAFGYLLLALYLVYILLEGAIEYNYIKLF